ncbi:MAG: hypothetical protein ACXWV1_03650, partial [Chitinophagaceae bacterium]
NRVINRETGLNVRREIKANKAAATRADHLKGHKDQNRLGNRDRRKREIKSIFQFRMIRFFSVFRK